MLGEMILSKQRKLIEHLIAVSLSSGSFIFIALKSHSLSNRFKTTGIFL